MKVAAYRPDRIPDRIQAILNRTADDDPELENVVRKVVADVRTGGDRALVDHTERFDQVRLCQENLRVREDEIEAAYRRADPNFLEILNAAAGNIRRFHESHPETSWFVEDGDGVSLGKRSVPIDRVAILIPGASAPLFSTLLMGAIPAQIAGVRRLCVATPPQRDGSVHPAVLAAARVLGLSEIYRVFGAQAVAALAYGTETIPKVDKIVGPGHPAVQIAKKIVFGTVGVDMVAGPSEIVVLADESADPRHVAADLLAQAEHGSGLEAAICITPSQDLAQKVAEEVERQLSDLARRDAIQKALDTFGAIVVVKDLSEGIDLANQIAPEHIELLVEAPWRHLEAIRNAGAVFLGQASAEPVGDYYAGTNHILPTVGAARFASSVGVETFRKTINVVSYTDERLRKTAGHIIALAEAEGLDAHANAIRVRRQ